MNALGLTAALVVGVFAPVWLLAVGSDLPGFGKVPSASGLTVIRAGTPAHRPQAPRAATRSIAPALVSLSAAAAPVFRRHAPAAAGGASHHAAPPAHALRAAAPRSKPARVPDPSSPPPPAPAPAPPTAPSTPTAPPSPSVGSSQLTSVVPGPSPVAPSATGTPVTHAVSGSDPATYWTPEQMHDAQPAPMGIPGGHSTGTTDPAPQPPAGGPDEVTHSPSASDPAAPWTPKRMGDAQPAPMGIPGGHSTGTTNPAQQPPTNSPPVPVTDSTSAASPGSSEKDQGSKTGAKAGGNGKGKK